jgi:hypothetical protein
MTTIKTFEIPNSGGVAFTLEKHEDGSGDIDVVIPTNATSAQLWNALADLYDRAHGPDCSPGLSALLQKAAGAILQAGMTIHGHLPRPRELTQ